MHVTYYYKEGVKTGVLNKIRSTINGFELLGYTGECKGLKSGSLIGDIKVAFELARENSAVVIIRSSPSLLVWFISLLILRWRRKKVVIDVATPKQIAIKEIAGNTKKMGRRAAILMQFFIYPLSWLPAHLILQHAHESPWFLKPVRMKTLLTGNPSPIKSTNSLSSFTEKWQEGQPINLFAVSGMHWWHGYDRLIEALSIYEKLKTEGFPPVTVHFVGEGPQRYGLELNATKEGVDSLVRFHGQKDADSLRELYADMHIGIGPLGSHRKGVYRSSPIKIREYMHAGLPVVSGTVDVDIPDGFFGIFYVRNDDSVIPLRSVVSWYVSHRLFTVPSQKKIYGLYEKTMSSRVKAKEILDALALN